MVKDFVPSDTGKLWARGPDLTRTPRQHTKLRWCFLWTALGTEGVKSPPQKSKRETTELHQLSCQCHQQSPGAAIPGHRITPAV